MLRTGQTILNGDPEVTVIIPCYNAQEFIEEALRSVESQTFESWKIIAVNDGSIDGTGRLLENASSRLDSRLTVVSGENRGACHARNLAIASAKSEFVAFLDADDIWEPDKLRLQMEALAEFPDAIAATVAFFPIERFGSRVGGDREFEWTLSEMHNWTMLGCRAPALNSTLLIRREGLVLLGCYDENLGSFAEELDLGWRLFASGKVLAVRSASVGIRSSESQIHRDTERMERSLRLVFSKVARQDKRLSERALANLELYLGVKEVLDGDTRRGLFRLMTSAISKPISVARFLKSRFFGCRIG